MTARLHRDEGGAVMVMGVFMAFFLVGLLYYMVGVGQTLMYRERMQDAADAGAFDAAVIAARGMNLISLLNVVMAALLAVVIAVRGTLFGVIAAAGLAASKCSSLSWWNPNKYIYCLAAIEIVIGPLPKVLGWIGDEGDQLEEYVDTMADAQDVLKAAIPLASNMQVDAVTDTFSPPVQDGCLVNGFSELPVEEMDLCDPARPLPDPFISDAPVIPAIATRPIRNSRGIRRKGDLRDIASGVMLATSQFLSVDGCDDGKQILEDAAMGDDHFQIQALMRGETPFEIAEQGLGTSYWGGERDSSNAQRLRELGTLSLAQAEFYFDGEVDREEWTWHMRWRARLRRFRTLGGPPAGLCAGDLAPLLLYDLDQVMVH